MEKFLFRFRKNPELYIGAAISAVMMLIIIAGVLFSPYDPDSMDAASKFASPSLKHLLGCDNFGRDLFSRLTLGGATTLLIAFFTVLIGITVGTLVGAFTGYYGGAVDEVLMRFNDAVLAFPSILLALVFISVFGSGTWKVIISLGIVFVPSFARIVRSEFMRCKNLDYVRSARLMGAKDIRIMFVHIFPNTVPVVLSSAVIGFNNAVLAEAGMSFLGIGVQPPASSLGRMLSDAQAFLFSEPGYAVFTGVTIALMVLGFSLLGDGLKKNA
ncbi:MAG: ABC transporter permease [Lachnospiraceae bacterium]|nr:ABC transporter permease [Lachnospiraceae bacterium]